MREIIQEKEKIEESMSAMINDFCKKHDVNFCDADFSESLLFCDSSSIVKVRLKFTI